jgi:hypothetical protein
MTSDLSRVLDNRYSCPTRGVSHRFLASPERESPTPSSASQRVRTRTELTKGPREGSFTCPGRRWSEPARRVIDVGRGAGIGGMALTAAHMG